jgi:hypothetical protein
MTNGRPATCHETRRPITDTIVAGILWPRAVGIVLRSDPAAVALLRKELSMDDLIPAVAYYRMSSGPQETSVRAQRVDVAAYAQEHGYHILREYKDEGISGHQMGKRSSL